MAEIIGEVVLERRPEVLDDEETRWRLEQAVERSQAREIQALLETGADVFI